MQGKAGAEMARGSEGISVLDFPPRVLFLCVHNNTMDQLETQIRTVDIPKKECQDDVIFDDGGATLEMLKLVMASRNTRPKLVSLSPPSGWIATVDKHLRGSQTRMFQDVPPVAKNSPDYIGMHKGHCVRWVDNQEVGIVLTPDDKPYNFTSYMRAKGCWLQHRVTCVQKGRLPKSIPVEHPSDSEG